MKDLPADHALGPDGFNGVFLKKCWNIIKEDLSHSVMTLLMVT
jgi:hypothetical protein